MKPHEFQTTIGTLGFLQFFGTSLQRMDLLTINKFKYISSTSLWNMVNELFRSEDLFRVVETKEVSNHCQGKNQLLN